MIKIDIQLFKDLILAKLKSEYEHGDLKCYIKRVFGTTGGSGYITYFSIVINAYYPEYSELVQKLLILR